MDLVKYAENSMSITTLRCAFDDTFKYDSAAKKKNYFIIIVIIITVLSIASAPMIRRENPAATPRVQCSTTASHYRFSFGLGRYDLHLSNPVSLQVLYY